MIYKTQIEGEFYFGPSVARVRSGHGPSYTSISKPGTYEQCTYLFFGSQIWIKLENCWSKNQNSAVTQYPIQFCKSKCNAFCRWSNYSINNKDWAIWWVVIDEYQKNKSLGDKETKNPVALIQMPDMAQWAIELSATHKPNISITNKDIGFILKIIEYRIEKK